ncbi:hypothetical protein J5N97_020695 [Dioscorea zingiberensis]|uniref:Tetrapyrrole methylase domain-containing protein n=1 Tax=Dioscorea zingiberensis TaxID=325984 RepID=A0A9D5HDH3_9LILI|nr:hypothetical protein J5N97_020695 [Dioscorea zingiberensis]
MWFGLFDLQLEPGSILQEMSQCMELEKNESLEDYLGHNCPEPLQVFGRGGKEMDFLQQQGIHVNVIPGITAVSGISAELGIPLTHRGVANSGSNVDVCVITKGKTKYLRNHLLPNPRTYVSSKGYLFVNGHTGK